MMRILHVADLHLKATGDERWDALLHIVAKANELNADVLAISGDLFDRENKFVALQDSLKEELSKVPGRVLILPGNHDHATLNRGPYFGNNVSVITSHLEPVDIDNVSFWGLPFVDAGHLEVNRMISKQKEMMDARRTHVLLYHGELVDSVSRAREDYGEEDNKTYRYMPVTARSFDDVPFTIVLAGHYHSRYRDEKFSSGCHFIYPGSPVAMNHKERGMRHACLVDIGKAPVRVPLDTARYELVHVTLDPGTADPAAAIRNALDKVDAWARVILEVDGFIDGEALGMTEVALVNEINDIVTGSSLDIEKRTISCKDIGVVLHHPLFTRIAEKLDAVDGELVDRARNIAIRAMMEVLAS